LPDEAKKIGVKWILKTKLNENVVKGYTQQFVIDYTEVFALVARGIPLE
jgi:hypothetical protein